MNEWLYAIILSLCQGITEFLPISSSAHMILLDRFIGAGLNNQAFMIVSQTGSLFAVLIYFREELLAISKNFLSSTFDLSNQDAKLGWFLIISTIPVVIIGGLFGEELENNFYHNQAIGVNTIVFGILLGFALYSSKKNTKSIYQLTWKLAIIIGIFQAIALFPGVSRSGITLTAGLLVGISITDSAKYALLLSIPVSVGALVLTMGKAGSNLLTLLNLLTLIASLLFSYLTLHFLFYLIRKANLWFFVGYRLILGSILLII